MRIVDCLSGLKSARNARGLTLVEVLFASAVMGMVAVTFATVYSSANGLLGDTAERILLDSELRGRMEWLISKEFSDPDLDSGSDGVTVNGEDFTISWVVNLKDMDGDSVADTDAKEITVSIDERPEYSLTTIVVDSSGTLGKVS